MQDRPINHAYVRRPVCPDCRKGMEYRMAIPHEKYSMLLHVMFVCDCGRVCDKVVANSMLAILPMQAL
jgi:hypothetical protein